MEALLERERTNSTMNAPELRWPAISVEPMNFIGNRLVAAHDGRTLAMVDPSDGMPFAAIARGGAVDVDAAVAEAARSRDGAWGRISPADRGRCLARLSLAISDHADELALLEARDCGKPLKQARADAAACARYFEFYAGACD